METDHVTTDEQEIAHEEEVVVEEATVEKTVMQEAIVEETVMQEAPKNPKIDLFIKLVWNLQLKVR